MSHPTTLDEIYAAINPLPAMLSAKGKVKPHADFKVDANASLSIMMTWRKPYAINEWESEYSYHTADDFAALIDKVMSIISDLPSAEQAKLHHFMGSLGKLIDAGNAEGIEVAYLNPLVETMKRLSENVITHQPKRED